MRFPSTTGSHTISVEDVLITRELEKRPAPECDRDAVSLGLLEIADKLVNSPKNVFTALLNVALRVCKAGTAGLSMLETTPQHEVIFRWTALAGTLAGHVGGFTPRNFSPCGVTLDRNGPQLFSYPGRYFNYFQNIDPPIVEGLVLPLLLDREPIGTIWIVSHDPDRHFNREDVLVMSSLAAFTVAATRTMRERPTYFAEAAKKQER